MIAGLAVFVFYFYFFIGSPQILLVLRNINPAQYALYYSLAILSVLASVFCWSAAWNSILRKLSIKISYKKSYLYYWVGNFADLIVPCATVCGEITRLYLVQKETNENYGAIAASSVTNRIVAYSVVTTGLSRRLNIRSFKSKCSAYDCEFIHSFGGWSRSLPCSFVVLGVLRRRRRNIWKIVF